MLVYVLHTDACLNLPCDTIKCSPRALQLSVVLSVFLDFMDKIFRKSSTSYTPNLDPR